MQKMMTISAADTHLADVVAGMLKPATDTAEFKAAMIMVADKMRCGLALVASGKVGVNDVFSETEAERFNVQPTLLCTAAARWWHEGVAKLLDMGADPWRDVKCLEGDFDAFSLALYEGWNAFDLGTDIAPDTARDIVKTLNALYSSAPRKLVYEGEVGEMEVKQTNLLITKAAQMGYSLLAGAMRDMLEGFTVIEPKYSGDKLEFGPVAKPPCVIV